MTWAGAVFVRFAWVLHLVTIAGLAIVETDAGQTFGNLHRVEPFGRIFCVVVVAIGRDSVSLDEIRVASVIVCKFNTDVIKPTSLL